jgi:hypothetical protein
MIRLDGWGDTFRWAKLVKLASKLRPNLAALAHVLNQRHLKIMLGVVARQIVMIRMIRLLS